MSRSPAAVVRGPGRTSASVLILHFLSVVGEARGVRISRYMQSQWGTPNTTTRNAIYRLAKAGRITRVGYGRYRRLDV